MQGRLEAVEKKLADFSITSNVAMRLMEIERASYQQQQYSCRECVKLVGLPESLQGEKLENKVVETFKHTSVSVAVRDFHAIHRLKKSKMIIAKCVNRRDAIAIFRAKKKLREVNEIDKKKLGISGKVFVNESQCPEYKRLQGICNALRKKGKVASFFTINRSIRITKTPEGNMFGIGHFKDLIDLVGEAEVRKVMESHQR